jgi:hypothetical protein
MTPGKVGVFAGLLGFIGTVLYMKHSKASEGVPVGVKQASIEGRNYEVFRRGGGTYEVISRSDPNVWLMFGQNGEIDARGSDNDLNQLREDMQHFPSNLFG